MLEEHFLSFMSKYPYEKNYEDDSKEYITFTFYNMEDSFTFLSLEDNCLTNGSKQYFKNWYEDGYFSSYIYQFMKNFHIFLYIDFINKCCRCKRNFYSFYTIRKSIYMNPVHSKIMIKYHYSTEWSQWIVSIRTMLECKECDPLYNRWYINKINHEVKEYICNKMKVNICNGLNTYMNKYPLFEPMLIKWVFYYMF